MKANLKSEMSQEEIDEMFKMAEEIIHLLDNKNFAQVTFAIAYTLGTVILESDLKNQLNNIMEAVHQGVIATISDLEKGLIVREKTH